MSRRTLLVLSLALGALAAAAPARAATGPEVGMADDRLLLAGGPRADRAVADWKALGVQVVRIHALWSSVAPAPRAIRPPAGFQPADPGDPGYDWSRLDAAVDRVTAAGMRVMLTITGPGPVWASAAPSRHDGRYRPRARAFAQFASAVAARFGDRVDRYIIWNEPNLSQWLMPQRACTPRVCTPVSPHVYRALARAAYPAIHAADPAAQVLIGALAPRGSDSHSNSGSVRPLAWLRALGCVDRSWHGLRSGTCRGFKPAAGDGFAFHPHGVRNAPNKPFANRDDVNLASLGHLEATLDRLQRMRRLRATTRRFDLYLDEYGYQTNPPDRFLGVSPRTQDRWLQQAAYIAWRDPRVRNLTQYVWQDEPARNGTYSGWQSGLLYASGRAKPALAHFGQPFFLDARRDRLWGQVRAGRVRSVQIQRRLRGQAAWRTVATVSTGGLGYWSRRMRLVRGATYRYEAGGAVSASARR